MIVGVVGVVGVRSCFRISVHRLRTKHYESRFPTEPTWDLARELCCVRILSTAAPRYGHAAVVHTAPRVPWRAQEQVDVSPILESFKVLWISAHQIMPETAFQVENGPPMHVCRDA